MKIKQGVSIAGCKGEILAAAITIIDPTFQEFGKEGVITSGSEIYKHSAKRSSHYMGYATDWRSWWFTADEKNVILALLKERLGVHFVVVLENVGKPSEHYHIHYAKVYEG